MNVIAVAVSTLVAVLISATYYALVTLPDAVAPTGGRSAPSTAVQGATEFGRSAVVAALVAGLVQTGDWATAAEGASLGLALWTLPVVLLAGSVVHESTPVRTAVVHSGDWLIKLVTVGALVGLIS